MIKIGSLFYFSVLLLAALGSKAQFTENFSDGDFSTSPAWTGSSTDWIVNSNFQLQSNNTVASSNYYLSTASALATTAQWEIYAGLSFNTSSANYVDIFLTASASDLAAPSTSGYFVRIGNTDDEVSLYRKAATGTITKIIDGTDGVTNSSANTLRVKVIRNAANQWTLYSDKTGTGNNYLSEGVVNDATFNTSSFFGISVKQSTASFFQKHFFDDIEVKPYAPDTAPPTIQSATVISSNAVDILFNEPLESVSAETATNYAADNSLGAAATAGLDLINKALVHLTFAGSLSNAVNYHLTINDVKDLARNPIANGTVSFTYFAPYTPHQYDIVIDEIMADPTPQVALPNNEWIELRNTSASAINLKDWKIGDASGESGPLPDFVLLPDSFVIICTGSAAQAMSVFGNILGVTSFPSLDNTGELLFLKSPANTVIHSVHYSDSWYQNELKKDGGWTLEMIDTKNPCSGFSNWKTSTDGNGGSPGKKNSVDAINPDANAPVLVRAYTTDSLHVVLVFDESLDSLKAATVANFTISDEIGVPAGAFVLSPSFDHIILTTNTPLLRSKVYTVTATTLTDCVGNAISSKNTARTGISEAAGPLDIVINEILFNPPSNGMDYVEIYNRSNKIIDLKQTYIANRNSSGDITSIAQLSTESNLLFPEDFIVATESAALVKAAYVAKNIDAFAEIATMPSFNDDKGIVIILNGQGAVTDELAYDEKWHFQLIDNREGVALERIDYNLPTQSSENWRSAATSAGYGTPTYKNSQYRITDGVQGEVKLSPDIVSPDNDGQDDFANLDYNFPEPGYVANITIFDGSGRPVRYLQRNALCGTTGSFRWDGLGEKNQRLAVGVYVAFTEIFNLKGNKKQFKNAIVLARRN